jgi:hypothetical protein
MAKNTNFTKKITVTASRNLNELARENGYEGLGLAADMLLVSLSPVVGYFFYTNDSQNPPPDVRVGLPVAQGSDISFVHYQRHIAEDALDLASTWICHDGTDFDIVLTIKGA